MLRIVAVAVALVASHTLAVHDAAGQDLKAQIFEIRTYTTNPGLLDNLHERFRDHTNHLFVKHGMKLVGYWTPADQDNTLIYILAFDSASARETSWQAFRDDPQWQEAYEASRVKAGGPIVDNVESTLMYATDYSPIR